MSENVGWKGVFLQLEIPLVSFSLLSFVDLFFFFLEMLRQSKRERDREKKKKQRERER
jgi:hypothetical protein